MNIFLDTVLDATLAVHLKLTFGLHPSLIALMFGVFTFAYLVSLTTVTLLYKCVGKATLIAIGVFGVGISWMLIGPCEVCQLPDQLWIVYVGLTLYGISSGFMYVPLLAHMIDLAVKEYEFENDDVLSDTLSGSINFFMAFGNLLGPILGGFAVYFWSFEHMSSLFGCICVIFGVFFVIVTFGTASKKSEMRLLSDDDCEMKTS